MENKQASQETIAEVKAVQDGDDEKSGPVWGIPEIKFSYTTIPGIFSCGCCGGAVFETEIHESWHLTGR